MNKESGFLGLCGEQDYRSVIKKAEAGDKQAQLALEACSSGV